MKILITGSHFTPAQATIEALSKLGYFDIVYVGRRYTLEGDRAQSVESNLLPKLGVKFIPITTGRLQRSFSVYTLPSLLKIPIGFVQALSILVSEKPDVVLSFGGYVAIPVVTGAYLLSIPIIIHEQTLVSGLANSICSLFADKIAVSFDINYSFCKSKIVLTGNPIRSKLLAPAKDEKRKTPISNFIKVAKSQKNPLLFITGGSQGSHIINQVVKQILEDLTEKNFVIHQVGDSRYDDFENLTKTRKLLRYPKRYLVKKWVSDSELAAIYRGCDLVISRAGINTLVELAYFAIPALVIPIPYFYNVVIERSAYRSEQEVNTKYFENLGLVTKIYQRDLSAEGLLDKIRFMINNSRWLKQEAKDAGKVVIVDAAFKLALETILLKASKDNEG